MSKDINVSLDWNPRQTRDYTSLVHQRYLYQCKDMCGKKDLNFRNIFLVVSSSLILLKGKRFSDDLSRIKWKIEALGMTSKGILTIKVSFISFQPEQIFTGERER